MPGSKPGERRGGRQKGTPNKVMSEAKALCRKLLASKAYLKNLTERLESGKLAPAVESMLWHYACGKPAETLEHTGADGRPIETLTRVVFGGRHKKPDDDAGD